MPFIRKRLKRKPKKIKKEQSKAARERMTRKASVNEDTQKDLYNLTGCEIVKLPSDTFFQVELHLKTGLDLSNNDLDSLDAGGDFSNLNRILSLRHVENGFSFLICHC